MRPLGRIAIPRFTRDKFRLLLVSLLFAVFVGGCVRKAKEPIADGVKFLTIWQTYNNEEHDVFLKVVSEYEKNNQGVKIKVQRIPWDQHVTKIKVAMITHTVPDIARVDPAFLPRLVRSRSVIDLSDYGADRIIGDLVPAAAQANVFPESFFVHGSTSSRKRIFGLPDQTTGVALFYNKKLFADAGFARGPATWEEFVKYAKALTRDLDGDGRADQFGFAADLSLWFTFPFFNTYGVKFISDDGKTCLLDSLAAREALQLKVDLYARHKVEAGAWQAGAISPDTGFINRKYAMIFTGPWNLKRFKDAGIPFGVSLIPRGPAGSSTNVGGSSMVVFRTSRHPDEAYKFLMYLVSPATQKKWAEALSQIPVNIKAYPMVNVSALPELKIFMEQMKTAVPRPKVLDYDELESIMNAEMYTALSGQKTVERSLKDAVEEINKRVLNLE
jgi:multiple sugar transport system substrate-binding protein